MTRKGGSEKDSTHVSWVSGESALVEFATFEGKTESAGHIKPLHRYIASRLVIEGGFHPDDITPRPPLAADRAGGRAESVRYLLRYDPANENNREQVILGGLKTKSVDVVVNKPSIGPVIAISCKGVTGAFRNLTNRMEETIGECTNLHITYPALVMGYFAILRANRANKGLVTKDTAGQQSRNNDIAVSEDGGIAESINRFHAALSQMTGRRGVRNEISRYESIAMILVESKGDRPGRPLKGFPPGDSPLRVEAFFKTLYRRYDERFVFGAPLLADRGITTRLEWAPDSPIFTGAGIPTSTWPELAFAPNTA